MHWLQMFDEARRRGSHAFLFTGGVGDGFPSFAPRGASEGQPLPVDTIFSFEKIVREHCFTTDGDALVWTFDPVSGFAFRNDKDERNFRTLAGLNGSAPTNDPIAQAAASTAEAMPLPTDPLAAMRLVRAAMDAATLGPPTRCVAIFPHADVLVPASGSVGGSVGGTPTATLVALALLQIIADDSLRRAGHVIALAAPTAASIHELLRRPDGSLTTVVIGKPTEDERRAFVETCCSTEILDVQQRRNDATAALEELRSREQERIGDQINTRREELRCHEATRTRVLADNRAYQCAVRQRDEAGDAHNCALAEHNEQATAERHALTNEANRLTARLRASESSLDDAACRETFGVKREPALVSEQMDTKSWDRLRVEDAVRLLVGDAQFIDLIVLDRKRDGRCVLSSSTGKNEPERFDATTTLEITWRVNAIIGKAGDVEQPMPIPEDCTAILRVPKARREIEERLRVIEEECVALTPEGKSESRKLRKAREAFESATQEVAAAETRCLAVWETRRRALVDARSVLEQANVNPQSDEIATLAQQVATLEREREAMQKRGHLPTPVVGIAAFVRLTQGLGYRDLATLLRDPNADEATVRERRIALLNRAYGHLLEVVEPPYGFEGLAGLAHVKRVLTMARDAMLRGDRKAVPQGIFLMGPPGTGKTAIAIAFARECGMLLVKMRSIRSMWVGQSEQRVEEVCQALLDPTPNVCFRDETDQEDSGRDAYQGDSGVSARIRQKLMEFEADERIRGRVLFVKATNRPDLVDAAMKRDGRADERLVVTTGDAEYAGLFPVYVQREGFPCEVTDFTSFVAAVRKRGFSGAGVLNLCRRAYQFGSGTITAQSLMDAIEDAVPSADRIADAKMTLAAIVAVSSRRNLPEDINRIVAAAHAALQGHARNPAHASVPTAQQPPPPDILDIVAIAGVDPKAKKN
ncbi:MAG: ATP-binding protein [Candidatus Uhrbacteria bacterium]